MNAAFVLCVLASTFYAVEIVLSQKMAKEVSPILLTLFMGIGVAIFAAPFALYEVKTTESVRLPQGKEWIVLVFMILFLFLGDWCHYAVLKRKASAAILATFYVLIPVICTVMKGEIPSWKMIGAWVLGGVALYLIGDELKEDV